MKKLLATLALAAFVLGTSLPLATVYAQEECPEGEIYNPETQQCEKSEEPQEPQEPECGEGQVYNPDSGECEYPQQ